MRGFAASMGVALASEILAAAPALAQSTTGDGTAAKGGEDASGGVLGGLLLLLLLLLALLFFAGIAALFILIFRHVMRRNQERTSAMQAYAQARGLSFEGDGRPDRVTPLLRHGGSALAAVAGTLPGGLAGRLANYRYSTGSKDNRRTYDFATVLAPLPEAGSARFYCYRRAGGELLDGISDALTAYQTVELESELFSRSFRLLVKDEANMLAIRQLFAPSFIVYLSEHVPLGFWFEVENGYLLGAIKGEHWERPAELDEVCVATAEVAARIRADIAERAGLRAATSPPPPPEPPPPAAAPQPPPPPPPAAGA